MFADFFRTVQGQQVLAVFNILQAEGKLPPLLTTEIGYNLIITCLIQMKFSGFLPDTHIRKQIKKID